jgi:hypothetical protein
MSARGTYAVATLPCWPETSAPQFGQNRVPGATGAPHVPHSID